MHIVQQMALRRKTLVSSELLCYFNLYNIFFSWFHSILCFRRKSRILFDELAHLFIHCCFIVLFGPLTCVSHCCWYCKSLSRAKSCEFQSEQRKYNCELYIFLCLLNENVEKWACILKKKKKLISFGRWKYQRACYTNHIISLSDNWCSNHNQSQT